MITNYILDRLLLIKDLKAIKEVLISIKGNLKEQAKKWWDNWQVTVLVYYILTWRIYQKAWFKL